MGVCVGVCVGVCLCVGVWVCVCVTRNRRSDGRVIMDVS